MDGRRVLDADGHVVEPGWLFEAWCPPGRVVLDLPATTPVVPCGDADVVADQLESGFDAPSYLRAMDRQQIDAVVLYPSIGLFVPFLPELSTDEVIAACRAYNEWIVAYCAAEPSRLAGVGVVPLIHVGAAVEEVERIADSGLVGVLARPNALYDRELGAPAYDRLWAAVAEAGLVLAVHEGLGLPGPTIGSERFTTFVERHACSHPLEQMAAMAGLLLGGALERHPTLRVAFLESGTGWLPYWLARLDAHADWMRDSECAALTMKPSEYFARQCVISSEADDELIGHSVASVGADHVVWASDFPHPDAVYPGAAVAFVAEASAHGVAAADIDAILWDTPLRFYGLADRFS